MRGANTYLGSIGTTIFTVMSALATEHKSINLGQGFPDTDGPEDVVQAAADTLWDGRNQYPPMPGVPELRQAVARANKRFYDLDIDWTTGVTVSSGATEAITASTTGPRRNAYGCRDCRSVLMQTSRRGSSSTVRSP